MSGPSLAELRTGGQPPAVLARLNDEHWAGRLYMRKLSPYANWVFARLGLSPNMVTFGLILAGLGGGLATAFGGLGAAVIAAAAIQLHLLLDCADGELARWSGRTSAGGIFLDRVGHYLTDAALFTGLGIRSQGHLTLSGGWVSAGLGTALLALIVKAETDSVVVARANAGLNGGHANEALAPRSSGLALARKLASALYVHRILQATELSLLILVAAIADTVRGGLLATHVLLIVCLVVAAMMVLAHLVAIMASGRLK
jgi:phosphatidylglycerophosphate synthase